VRTVRLIREIVLDLLVSAIAFVLLFISVQELIRRPGLSSAMLGGMVPVTVHKWPWLLVIAAVLLALWFLVRAIGGPQGTLWGALQWLVRVGLWWSAIALLLFLGVAINGAFTHNISELNWGFALGYLAIVLPILIVCGLLRRRGGPTVQPSN
jgi:hypothetical protein